jgi:hypothetical protein
MMFTLVRINSMMNKFRCPVTWLSSDMWRSSKLTDYSFGWWLMAGAGLF